MSYNIGVIGDMREKKIIRLGYHKSHPGPYGANSYGPLFKRTNFFVNI